MTKESVRNKFDETRNKSEDDFEKSLTLISAGSLGLSMAFIEKIVTIDDSTNVWTLITGWVFLALTLFLNLISHLISSYYSRISQEEFDAKHKDLNKNIDKRNKNITRINWLTVILLIIGISFIVIFASINISKMAKDNQPKKTSNLSHEKFGRTIPKPADTTKVKPKGINTKTDGKKTKTTKPESPPKE
jgi:uncharacterized membrane protein